MGRDVNTDDLVSAVEVAAILGLAQSNTVTTYLHRYADFPRPVIDKSRGRIRLWLRQEIEAWAASRPGR